MKKSNIIVSLLILLSIGIFCACGPSAAERRAAGEYPTPMYRVGEIVYVDSVKFVITYDNMDWNATYTLEKFKESPNEPDYQIRLRQDQFSKVK